AARRLKGHHFYGLAEQLRPRSERYEAAARIGKTKQTSFREGAGPGRDQPLWRRGQLSLTAQASDWTGIFCTNSVFFAYELCFLVYSDSWSSCRVISFFSRLYRCRAGRSLIINLLRSHLLILVTCNSHLQ